jgi:TonB family protein
LYERVLPSDERTFERNHVGQRVVIMMAHIGKSTVDKIKNGPEKRRLPQVVLIVAALSVTGLSDRAFGQDNRFRSILDSQSLTGWLIENAPETQARISDGILTVSGDPGWIRTESVEFGTFVLQFDARMSKPEARAMVALFGRTDPRRGTEYAFTIPLFGREVSPFETAPPLRRTSISPSVESVASAMHSSGDWQAFQLVRRESVLVLSVNGTVVLAQDSPRTLDGWIGFLTQGSAVEFRNIRIAPSPAEQGPVVYKAGKDGVTVPRLLHREEPSYTKAALDARIQGNVLLECVIGVDGSVASAVVARSLDQRFGLDEAAVRAARLWRFAPALRLGIPVPVVVTIDVGFRVRQ